MQNILYAIFPMIIAVIIGTIMIPKVVLISKRKKIYDVASGRKSHTIPTSRLGGTIFLPSILIAITATVIFNYLLTSPIGVDVSYIDMAEISAFVLGFSILYMIGLADDFIGITYKTKFLAQIFVAVVLILVGHRVGSLDNIFGVGDMTYTASFIFTFIALLGIINSYNLIDGIDGLCSGIAIITSILFLVWFMYSEVYIYAIVSSAFLGSCIIFFRYNIVKSRFKLFMGDTGSLVVGFVVCFLLLEFIKQQESLAIAERMNNYMVVAFSVIFVPTIDTLRVFGGRRLRGQNPFTPDRTHLHHLLLDIGLSHRQATSVILSVIMVIILITYFVSFVFSATVSFLLLLVYGVIITYVLPLQLGRYVNNVKKINK